jgi:signal transduction histidine kinase
MTEIRGQLPETGQASAGDVRPSASERRSDERRAIGRRLHQGILQDLTVAGLRLKALEDQAAAPTATAIGEFAAWLRERQAELRRYVAALEQGLGDTLVETELARLADALLAQHQCRLSIDRRVRSSIFPQDMSDAVVRALGGVLPLLAGDLNARNVAIALDDGAEATLRITHDGGRLQEHATQLTAVRRTVGGNGASLRIEPQQATETLILDWAN